VLDNPLRKFECDGTILGFSKLIISDENYVYKYLFNKSNWPNAEAGVELLKEFDPDFYVDMYRTDNYLCYITNKIDFIESHKVRTLIPYKDTVCAHLALYKQFGSFVTKRDLCPSNILFRKSDHRPFLIDWDQIEYFKTNEECYKFYRVELCCNYFWHQRYRYTQEQCEEAFDMEWEKLQ